MEDWLPIIEMMMRKERLCENISGISRHNRMSAVIKQMESVIWVTKSMSFLIPNSVHMNVLKIFQSYL